MQPEPLTREDVIHILGEDVDEELIAEVLATHATLAQLTTAVEQLRNESFGWTSTLPPDAAVVTLREVLTPWWEAESEPEYLGTD